MTRFRNRQVLRRSQIYSATVFERLDRVKTSNSMRLGRRSRWAVRNAGLTPESTYTRALE